MLCQRHTILLLIDPRTGCTNLVGLGIETGSCSIVFIVCACTSKSSSCCVEVGGASDEPRRSLLLGVCQGRASSPVEFRLVRCFAISDRDNLRAEKSRVMVEVGTAANTGSVDASLSKATSRCQ